MRSCTCGARKCGHEVHYRWCDALAPASDFFSHLREEMKQWGSFAYLVDPSRDLNQVYETIKEQLHNEWYACTFDDGYGVISLKNMTTIEIASAKDVDHVSSGYPAVVYVDLPAENLCVSALHQRYHDFRLFKVDPTTWDVC
jgi:hypothetical protein